MYVALLLVAVAAVTLGPAAVTTEHGAVTTEHGAGTTEHSAGPQHATPVDVMYLFDAILSPHTINIDNNQGGGFTSGGNVNNKCGEGQVAVAGGNCVNAATVAPGTTVSDYEYRMFMDE